MFNKQANPVLISACLLSLASFTASADPDLPEPPDPDELPEPEDLPKPPKPDPDEGTWWDPLGFFSDDDNDRGHGRRGNPHDHVPPGHRKHDD